VTSAIGGGYGLIYSIWNSQPWMSLGGRAAVNSGLVGWSFFGIREILVSPLLTSTLPWKEYQRRRIAYKMEPLSSDVDVQSTTVNDVRKNRLLDTFISGGLTGSIMRTIKRGPGVLAPSFVTSGLLCSLFQFGINEITVQRIQQYSRKRIASHSEEAHSLTFRERLERWQQTAHSAWRNFLPRKLSDEEYAERIAASERIKKERQAAKES